MVVPAALRSAMTAAHGPAGAAWCDRLPGLVAGYADRWGVPVGEPFPVAHHWVAPAGAGAVLKIGYPASERDVAREAAMLATWAGHGAVRLLAADVGGDDAEAVLLERVHPGTDLTAAPDEEALPLLGRVARALHTAGRARPALALDAAALADLHAGHPALPRALSTIAADLLDDLQATCGAPVLCHGDLHHGNVLRSGTATVVIDPRGVWGDPALDVGVALLNPLGSLPAERTDLRALLERRLALICPAMGVDIDRGRGWTVVSAVVSALWTAQDGGGVDDTALAVADVLR
ncbi:aminoglycoside phosphotransferase family protein [Modestobacter sp. DSM 44400]|uniref:aminoglycoside phosphotransferase family protein n=1 Tax=Modestobacter sp. DSM 44400 TaxID=1550230 RepID=UPI0015873B70|nr:aminoglycoside phosphotransferase family protein [Modestobacter sp. DSM 44400]